MKKVFNIIVSVALAGAVASCNGSLEEEVFSSITEQSYNYSEDDFDPIVASIYPPLRDFPDTGNYLGLQQNTSDETVMPPNASGWDDGGVFRVLHYQTWNSEHSGVRGLWGTLYRGALLCNNVIDQIENDVIPASDVKKAAGIAEARAMRAYYYWLICDNFGDAPLVADKSKELPTKTPRADIYKFVESELLDVIPNLTEETGANTYGRMTKWAATCLLANLYLNAEVYTGTAEWDKCKKACDDIINSGKWELESNYNASFRAQGVESSKEILFSIPFDETFAGGQYILQFSWNSSLKDKFLTQTTPWGAGSMMGITQFIDTYDEDDTRLEDTWLMGEQLKPDGTPVLCAYDLAGEPLVYVKDVPNAQYTKENEGYRMFKFEVEEGAVMNQNTDYPLFRYSEVLMMKAECLLRLNQAGAGALVTQVRQRAFKDNIDKAIVTDADLKENSCYKYGFVEEYIVSDLGNTDAVEFGRLYDELGWEFAWESHRRRDMIRFGTYTTKSYLSHKPEGDYRSVFPIPETALTSNPNLEQNPNY